jgi:hypothetical protein
MNMAGGSPIGGSPAGGSSHRCGFEGADFIVWADGLDGQEDELEDVHKGILDPPTDDEGAGSILEKNDAGRTLESEDEDDEPAAGEREDDESSRPSRMRG